MQTWFSADWHFGHTNIIRYCKRPFASVEEMNQKLIQTINSQAKILDTIYFLGDFTLSHNNSDLETIKSIRRQINCANIHLIIGNHDNQVLRLNTGLFSSVSDYQEIKVNGQFIVLSHYAMRVWNKSHRGSWQLYGHSHGTLPDDPNLLSIDVGIDCHQMKMLSFEDVKAIMAKKTWVNPREQWEKEGKLWKKQDVPEEELVKKE